MNKLAVLAFALLAFFSTMLWYLADGSLNDYLKSQIKLQGQYYAKQASEVAIADFSASTGVGHFSEITLVNPTGYQAKHAMIIDHAIIELAANNPSGVKGASPFQRQQGLITTIRQLTIDKLIINHEQLSTGNTPSQTNISQLITAIKNQLAQDYPALYPEISAKLYADKNPELNAETYAINNPSAGPIIEHKKTSKKRGKAQAKIMIENILVKELALNQLKNGVRNTSVYTNIKLAAIGGKQGIVSNQIGGEVLLALLNLSQ